METSFLGDHKWGVISSCNYAASGLHHLLNMHKKNYKVFILNQEDEMSGMLRGFSSSDVNCYIIYIPDEPFYFLLTLRSLFKGVGLIPPDSKFIFISGVSCNWFTHNISNVFRGGSSPTSSVVISAKLSVSCLGVHIDKAELNFPLNKIDFHSAYNNKFETKALTLRETEALLDYFYHQQNTLVQRNSQVAIKTLYSQRKSGLRKIAENSSDLVKGLPGASRRWKASRLLDDSSHTLRV